MRPIVIPRWILGIGLFLCPIALSSQSAVLSGGGMAQGSGGSVSYSIGQVAYSIKSSDARSLYEGLQQPIEISIITGLARIPDSWGLNIYPNPASVELNIEISQEFAGLNYYVMDATGRRQMTGVVDNSNATLAISSLPSGMYFLQLVSSDQAVANVPFIKL